MNKYMEKAIIEAKKALKKGEVPVGAVIVKNDKIIARAHNQKEKKKNVIAHAEMIALSKAFKKIKNWRLNETSIYITLYPCPMCASAIQQARIENVFYAVDTQDEEAKRITNLIFKENKNNKSIKKITKIENEEAKKMLQMFFQKKR